MEDDKKCLNLAGYYLSIERPSAALECLGKISDPDFKNETYWFVRTRALSALGRYTEASGAASAGLSYLPESSLIMRELAMSEWSRGKVYRAEQLLKTALAMKPEDPLLLVSLSVVLATGGKRKRRKSLLLAQKAAEVDPENPIAQIALIRLAEVAGDTLEIEWQCLEMLEKYPDSAYAHHKLGECLQAQGRLKDAAERFGRAAALEPENGIYTEAVRRCRLGSHWFFYPSRLFDPEKMAFIEMELACLLVGLFLALMFAVHWVLGAIWSGVFIVFVIIAPCVLEWLIKRKSS